MQPRAQQDAPHVGDGGTPDAAEVAAGRPEDRNDDRPDDEARSSARARWGRRARRWAKKAALVAGSTALTLLVLEGGFRLFGYRPVYDVYSKPSAFWRHDPLLGWSLEPGAEGEYVGPRPFPVAFRATVRVNERGLRGGEIEALPTDGRRVLVVGDSQAAGFEVEESDTYGSLLEDRLDARLEDPVQVVNAGVRGYGTDQTFLQYRERLRDLRPDVVVYHVTGNDPEDNVTLHRMRRPFGKPAFVFGEDGELELRGTPVPEFPLCSAQRMTAEGRAERFDSARSRAFCLLQTQLADRSALFSFVTARVQRNPQMVRALYDLGSPVDAEPPPAEPQPSRSRRRSRRPPSRLRPSVARRGPLQRPRAAPLLHLLHRARPPGRGLPIGPAPAPTEPARPSTMPAG